MIGNLGTAFLGVVGTDVTPVVYTLTLDDLSTRFMEYDGAAASIKFKLTATNGGGALTTSSFVYLDSSQGSGMAANALDAVGDVATLIQTQLNALAGYSGVTVNGVATVPGDQWDFTITFPGALGVTGLAFHASSQFYPTIITVEATTQEGRSLVPAVQAVWTLTCTGPNGADATDEVVNLSPNGQVTFVDEGMTISGVTPPTGWTATAGGFGEVFVTFTQDVGGAVTLTIASQSEDGTYSLVENTAGADEITAVVEIHTITPQPVAPTGGNWAPNNPINSVDWNGNDAAVQASLDVSLGGGVVVATDSGAAGISDGIVTVTWVATGPIDNGALSPQGTLLTAPEITHSIA